MFNRPDMAFGSDTKHSYYTRDLMNPDETVSVFFPHVSEHEHKNFFLWQLHNRCVLYVVVLLLPRKLSQVLSFKTEGGINFCTVITQQSNSCAQYIPPF